MDFGNYKGFSLVKDHQSDLPISCFLLKIAYEPSPEISATVGFALFEAREEPRKTAVRFAQDLLLIDSISLALGGEPIKNVLDRAQIGIRSLVAGAIGTSPLLLPQNFNIPKELKIFPPMRLEAHNFESEVEQQSDKLFSLLRLWSKGNRYERPRNYGYDYLRRNTRNRFVEVGLWRHRELEKRICVTRFIPTGISFKIYLAYRDLRNNLYRMLQPISIMKSSRRAEFLASNWHMIRDGLQSELQMNCEMRAIVEDENTKECRTRLQALRLMESVGIRIDPLSSLPALAADAQAALRSA